MVVDDRFKSKTSRNKQSGLIMVLLVAILLIGATSYFVGTTKSFSWWHNDKIKHEELDNLYQIKRQLLLFGSVFTELYGVNNGGDPKISALVPSPGYLPCPFNRVSGTVSVNCKSYVASSSPGYAIGFLPAKITNRNFYFLGNYVPETTNQDYILVLDERFGYSNNRYSTNLVGGVTTNRFAPLNDNLSPRPVLQLNDNGKEYVALIINPKSPLGSQASKRPASLVKPLDLSGYLDTDNSDGDFKFYSAATDDAAANDLIIGITYDEWQNAVKARICGQKEILIATENSVKFWFNAYSASNPSGAGWRNRLTAGFCD